MDMIVIDSPFELIIGKPDLLRLNLHIKCHNQFWQSSSISELTGHTRPLAMDVFGITPSVAQQIIAATVEKEELLSWEDDSDGIELRTEDINWSALPVDTSSSLVPPQIFGDNGLKEQLIRLYEEYIDIFSRVVRETPANLPPMTLDVDIDKWHCRQNMGPPRVLSNIKQDARTIIEDLLRLKVMRPSQAVYRSQVHLVPKPNGKWRLCLDY